jgi:seryl-tRNA synthetase
MPRGPETQIYSINDSDLSLIATAEITLGGAYHERIFEAAELPLKLCGISHCFRTEAGAHGRATRGLYRVHQFTKVEMFAFTLPEQSTAMHDQLLDLECRIFDGLGIPYRVIDTASGDLGGPAYRKFDLEAWMPGRGEAGEWGEVTSTSNCTDYQSRRLALRYRTPGEKGTQFVHTLNATACAVPRMIVAIIENFQQADGINNNNYYIPSGSVGFYNGSNAASLSAWKTNSGKDLNGISVNPPFISSTDLPPNFV